MTLPAALPFSGAALRVMRGAAGRRALHVVVLVGGLFALGLLCGEQVHAADGTPTVSTAAETVSGTAPGAAPPAFVRSVKGTARQAGRTISSAAAQEPKGAPTPAARPVRPEATAVPSAPKGSPGTPSRANAATPSRANAGTPSRANVGPVADVTKTAPAVQRVVRPVAVGLAGGVVRPVGDLADTVADGLADASSQVPVPSFPSPPSPPSPPSLPPLPSLPALPEPPSLPGLPGLSGLPTSPVQTLPAPASPRQPGGTAAHAGSAEQRETQESPAAYGPPAVGASSAGGNVMHRAPHGAGPAQAPAQQAPGDPTGELGPQSAVDNGAPRHGDAHAVTLDHRAPLRLVPGATAVVTADGTRDRYRDIPEFPG
ncbi:MULTISPECIES: hypothetical protein [Streptomyces]|uniref:Uncharacterized protein n=1 Tax=Streptomyces avermitilis TaxID=33903 RepID=A0A4D4LQT8_STRAX|nr:MULTISPECIES: hypothetical protein [Streptomyces]MYS99047.1 hypothetical protein [Streptomyces sp. SID5469]BBJ51342.1 hypothetical protein SAVMC3_39710 [Streptomyces avermitilis]GDY63385.1 hypothetical protein SAV14893_027780 [Streptomyces avermitilis]GDY85419.1 hypothetical protein SAVCW2_46180 [Streptomyces avermitilis]